VGVLIACAREKRRFVIVL